MKLTHPWVLAVIAAGVLQALPRPAAAQSGFVAVNKAVRLAAPVRPAKGGTSIYIVKLKAPGAAGYKGGLTGFAATKPAPGERLDKRSGAVQTYAKQLELTHDRLLAEIGAADSKVYSYRYALDGFAAKLTAEQVSRLARSGQVERIWPDTDRHLQTNNSAIFLGLEDQVGGLRADLNLRGEDIVVGIIDSGIAPNHPSLAAVEERVPRVCQGSWATSSWLGLFLCSSYRRHPPTVSVYDPPTKFHGACEAGEGFAPTDCNNKVVGARFYLDGFLFEHQLDPNEFRSPRDVDGHGTHIATIVAGNPVDAYLFGTRVARVSGIAPRARVAIYKACWLKPGDTRATCTTSDLTRAIDDAVADGVDIINYSIGSLDTDLTAPDDMALLNALDAGVLSVVAAGNDGPNLDTIGTPSSAPWVLTAAASTQSGEAYDTAIEITAPADLAGKVSMREASFTPPLSTDAIEGSLITADDGQSVDTGSIGNTRDACQPLTNGSDVSGHIVLIQRGACEFQVKLANAEAAGAVAAIVYSDSGSPTVMNGDTGSVGIPAVMIGTGDGQQLVDRLTAGDDVEVKLAKGIYLPVHEDGNVMADFSSRGPPRSDQNFLKPDVTAPGVDILAGQTPDVANGIRGETYQYLSGTSQSAPEVAGIAALLKEAHPDWTPGRLKSALMTTAYQSVTRSDGSAANPFDMGAGHIDPNRAIDPGLVYDSDYRDNAAYLCGYVQSPIAASECQTLDQQAFPRDPRQMNLPSIALADLITGDTVKRRVTNVGPPATYTAEVTAPQDFDVIVDPPTLSLNTGETAEFSLRFADRAGAVLDLWDFGQLRWSDGTHTVASPIAVQPVTLRAPAELHLSGTSGSTTVATAFGYSGPYAAGVHGLRPPFADPQTGDVPRGFVDDDPTRTFTFRFDNGVTAHAINVAPDQLYLRVALFDEYTDGNDDLDLYLFYCPNDSCTQIGQSGGFTSNEEIDVTLPDPGLYMALVHGFRTDQVAGGPGANYSLFSWSVGLNDDAGNLTVEAPDTVAEGDRLDLAVQWSGLDAGKRYLGAISHSTPTADPYGLTIVNVATP